MNPPSAFGKIKVYGEGFFFHSTFQRRSSLAIRSGRWTVLRMPGVLPKGRIVFR
jgi:hypothetical protein